MKYCFGIDIGGTTIKMGIFEEDGTLLSKWQIPTRAENQGEAILSDIVRSICGKLDEYHIASEDVIGMGVGVPAAVCEDGTVETTTNLGWGYKEVKRELQQLTGFSVCVENDANLAALGEQWKGVGGGIIIEGHILSGVKGGAGEIGEILVDCEVQNDAGIYGACRLAINRFGTSSEKFQFCETSRRRL